MLQDFPGTECGGGGGIRTHVGAFTPHPISSRCRYDRFGTPPNLVFTITPVGLNLPLLDFQGLLAREQGIEYGWSRKTIQGELSRAEHFGLLSIPCREFE
jgi:hypothetical protein